MTKKHFKVLAEIIRQANENAKAWQKAEDVILFIAQELCSECKRENQNFDKDRFLAACGYPLK